MIDPNEPTPEDEQEVDQTAEGNESPVLVAIGASAGGLEAIRELIAGLPASGNVCYLIAQHLSPKHKSLLHDLLVGSTNMRVVELEGQHTLEPSVLYITPSNHDVEFANGTLNLIKAAEGAGPKPSVDHLLSSLADNYGRHTVSVVLSGTGSDGAAGVRAVRAAGGLVVVQEPSSAKFDGMPRAAIQTQCADLVLPPAEMGDAIERYLGASRNWVEPETEGEAGDYQRIFAAVRRACGMDLSQYKAATVRRRIARRMGLRDTGKLAEYATLVRGEREEARQLGRDVIISVTEFFRDDGVFTEIESVLAGIIQKHGPDDVVRVWVAGTATGEEAYTFAMILNSLVSERKDAPDYLIFASDLDNEAIERARHGVYSDTAVANVPPEYRSRYLERVANSWQVKKSIRQNIVFAVQDIISDPPFSRLDLVSCRNVLIYLNKNVQQKVMQTFHYSLNRNGHLLLGKSETADSDPQLFDPIDTRMRIYKKRAVSRDYAPRDSGGITSWESRPGPDEGERKRYGKRSREECLVSEVMHALCPPGLVINSTDRIEHFVGDLSSVLRFPRGNANLDFFEMLPEDLRAEFRAMIYRCRREQKTIEGRTLTFPGVDDRYRCVVEPLQLSNEALTLISFQKTKINASTEGAENITSVDSHAVVRELEGELATTRQHLQTVVEELETSNEELQSQSEELQSANEELQSTNEELQTSNEELQSTNEELLTVNDELQSKSVELENTASTLVSVRESLGFPILVLDVDMHVLQFSQNVNLVAEIDSISSKASVTGINWHTDLGDLVSNVRTVIQTSKESTYPVDIGKHHFLLRITPNIDQFDKLLGVVLVFVDVTARVDAENRTNEALLTAKAQEQHYATTLAGIADSVITVDSDGRVTFMNVRAEELSGWTLGEAQGISIEKILQLHDPETQRPALPLLRQTLGTGRVVDRSGNELLVNVAGEQHRITVEESASPLVRDDGELDGAVLVFRDVTSEDARASELIYRASHDSLTGLLNREEFERRLSLVLTDIQKKPDSHAVVAFLDLDQFKVVNDTVGHAEGDKLLRQVALLFKATLRNIDVIARLGGDEFGILCPGLTESEGREAFKKLLAAFAAFRFESGSHTFTIGASIGALSLLDSLPDVSTVFRLIDSACYQAKDDGRNRVNVAQWNDQTERQRVHEAQIAAKVVRALDDDRLELHAQAIFDTSKTDKAPSMYEILLRLRDEEGQLMVPYDFIAIAERANMLQRVDAKVCATALRQIQNHSEKDVIWTINLSAQSVESPDFREYLLGEIEYSGIPGARLCFEITETTAIRHMPDAVEFVNALRRKGCLFALDDFGSGMSSFGYLNKLKVDYLKIDGSFVSRMTKNKVDFSLVDAMTRVGHESGFKVVAEHVADKQTLAACKEVGADYVQGFYTAEPQPLTVVLNSL